MGQGKVTVNNLNLGQGNFPEVERKTLFIGVCATGVGDVLSLNTQSDLDVLLGAAASDLKTQVIAARANGGENWQAYAAPIAADDDWREALDLAFLTVSTELVAVCKPITTGADLTAAFTKAEAVRTQQARRVIILIATPGIDADTQTWAAYTAAQAALTAGISAYRVAAVPQLHGNNLGVLAGRLCNRAVSIADSPMRVETGTLLGLGDAPVDSTGLPLPSAVLATLDANRLSVPQWYTDYPGMFWGDCNLLDEPGGDYQVIENLRVIDKAARRVRIRAIKRVANRSFNDSTISTASNKTYFMGALRDMSKSTVFAGVQFPGEMRPPADDSITIVWLSQNSVEIYIKIVLWNSPKEITANLILDLSSVGG